ncbi:MAG TPA: hypothetical protein VJZ27_05775, partial [Aggregatilineales bacterium]|nr:hypothetical protein [Aggregatilineales bacterium]
QFNNTGTASKNVRVVVHDELWGNYFLCGFTVAGNNPGLQTYTVRGLTNRIWGNAYIDFYDDTASGNGFLQVDNVNVQYKPALSVTATECIAPAPLVALEAPPTDADSIDARATVTDADGLPELNADAMQSGEHGELIAEIPVLRETPTPVPAAPVIPPVTESLDNGAGNWSASTGWILTGEADADGAGSGWQASAGVEPAALTFAPMLDLRSVSNPMLGFQTQLISTYSAANVEVSLDGINWQVVAVLSATDGWQNIEVDLHAYRGQLIALRFMWHSRLPEPGDPGVDIWWLDEVVIENTQPPTVAPTATAVPTDVPTAEPTAVPTAHPTETPTTVPTEPSDPAPADDVPLDAEPPTR